MAWSAPRGITDIVERVHRQDPSLASLCLFRGRRFNDEDAEQLCSALAGNTVLRELSISSHAVSTHAAAAFARMLAANSTLRSLDLGNSSFGDEGLAALAPGIAASASLRHLNLERKGLSAQGCATLSAALAGSSAGSSREGGLEELLLGSNNISNDGLKALLEGLEGSGGGSSSSSLRLLDLSVCDLKGATAAQPLAAALQQGLLPRLQSLRLYGNDLGAAGAEQLAAAVAGSNLQQLHLQRCSIPADGVAALVASLPAALTTLDLSGNAVGSQGAAALAAALKAGAAPQLRKLLLCGCGLDDGSIAELAAALASRDSGSSEGLDLDLSGNVAGAAAVAALGAALLTSLCLHDCKLGGNADGSGQQADGGEESSAAEAEAAVAALAEQLAAPGSFRQLQELDVSANRLQVPALLRLLAAATPAADSDAELPGAAPACCPNLRLLVIAANPGAADERLSAAIEALQEARPSVNVVRRAADTGEGGMMGRQA